MRQGDISFQKVDKKINGKQSKKLILKHGESGNKHMLVPVGKSSITFEKIMGDMYFEVKNGQAILKHSKTLTQEVDTKTHKIQVFDEGVYKMNEEQEYNPFTEQISTVID